MQAALSRVVHRVSEDDGLWSDFNALCDFGGRRAGTASEQAALDWCEQRLRAVPGARSWRDRGSYPGWQVTRALVADADSAIEVASTPLLGSAFTPGAGVSAELLDLGLGRPEDVERHRARIPGRIVLVRHEYPFATGHVHRRRKLALAQEAGAVGFLIAVTEPELGPVSGSTGRSGGPGIPAFGLSMEAAQTLLGGSGRVRLQLDGQDEAAPLSTLVLELPGASERQLVLSAHLDGHPRAESAIDNATGLAGVLAIARALAGEAPALPCGLMVTVFSAEEWGLAGSRIWLAELDGERRQRMAMNVNLDSIAGARGLTALTSDFPQLDPVVERTAALMGEPIAIHRPLMPNSDHANFAAHGIPALRLLAGFNDPDSNLRCLLTDRDTRALVGRSELMAATRVAAALVWEGLCWSAMPSSP